MKEIKRRAPRMEDLIPDAEKRQMVLQRLYQGDPLVGDGGIFTDLLQALVNAALEGELDGTLSEGTESGERNRRNGHNTKHVKSRVGPLEVHTPRDRQGIHEPKLIGKWDRELSSGMDEIILSMYAHGQSIEDIRRQLQSLYGVEMSSGTISAITDRVYNEIINWQQRTLNSCYAIVYLDAIYYKIREDSKVVTKAVYTVYGVDIDGQRDILGFYLQATEGARYWGLVLEDIKKRGVEDVLFFCVDGLSGFKEVISQIYPMSIIQRCIVHMVRASTRFVSDKDLKAICVDLRKIYNAADRDQAAIALEAFGEKWDKKYKEIRPKWEENWDELMAFMDYSENIRRMIYTTNPVEALHRIMRKVTKTKGAWISEKALIKQLYLSLMHNKKSWSKKAFGWPSIARELKEYFGERFDKYAL